MDRRQGAARSRSRNALAGDRPKETGVKVVQCEELHVDAGWDVYSFLKLTTGALQ
jgi:hypothetical protein